LQLVACQKVGNQLLNKDIYTKHTPDKAFEFFRYFIDMRHPKDKDNDRQEITVLFMLNLKDELDAMDLINRGYESALKKGTIKVEKDADGKKIEDVYSFIFFKWNMLQELFQMGCK
jgi:hypothetical protein